MFRKREDPFEDESQLLEPEPQVWTGPKHAKPKVKRKVSRGWRIFELATRTFLVIMVLTIAALLVFGYLKK